MRVRPLTAARWYERLFNAAAEEEVIGAIRHERLFAYIAGDGASGSRSGAAFGVQALNEAGLSEKFTASRPFVGANDLQ